MIKFYTVEPTINFYISSEDYKGEILFPKNMSAILTTTKSGVTLIINNKGQQVKLSYRHGVEFNEDYISIDTRRDKDFRILERKYAPNFKERNKLLNAFIKNQKDTEVEVSGNSGYIKIRHLL